MTEQLKAEAYVRSQRPALMELSFGCDVIVAGIREDNPGCENDVVVDSRKDEHGRIGLGYFGHVHPDGFKIIGHPILLSHWLAELGKLGVPVEAYVLENGLMEVEVNYEAKVYFNLTTGQPNSPDDYKNFNDITRV